MSVQTDAKPLGFVACSGGQKQRHEPLLKPSYEIHQEESAVSVSASEKDVKKFTERKELLVSPFEYARNGTSPGLVLIFNQETFEDKTYRFGSRRDVNEIITCMSRLGFNINENHIYVDYTREKILDIVTEITNSDLSEYNCLIVFFLTHGNDFNMLHAYDSSLQTHEIWKEFSNCKDLKEKPKMFIFQACKGGSHSSIATEYKDTQINLVPESTFTTDYIGPDMLVIYSTTEGNVSFRDSRCGTWFIQELCKNFTAYGRRDDVVSLVIRATKCICRNYFHYDDVKGSLKKQMPVFVSTLTKKFYLNRNKDRHILYKLKKNQETMAKCIKDLEDKVNALILEKEKQTK